MDQKELFFYILVASPCIVLVCFAVMLFQHTNMLGKRFKQITLGLIPVATIAAALWSFIFVNSSVWMLVVSAGMIIYLLSSSILDRLKE